MTRPQAVILDLGGVVMREPRPEHVAALGAICGLEADAFEAAWSASRIPYDCGDLTAAEYWLELGIDDGARLQQALEADAEAWSTPNVSLAAWLGELHEAGVRTAILSNMPREQWDRLGPIYERWLERCDEVTLSFAVGAAKPEARIYRHCLDRLGVAAGDALFLDDRAENVDAALALGLDAIRYTTLEALLPELARRYDGALPYPAAPPGAGA